MRNITLYSQNDSRWSVIKLGGGPDTIGQGGCYISSYAMVGSYYGKTMTPVDVNNFLIAAKLYVNGDEIGGDDTIHKIWGDIAYEQTYHYETVPADLTQLKTLLTDTKRMVMVEIDLGGGNVHFAVVVDCDGTTVTIGNPYDGQVENFTKLYGDPKTNILKFVSVYGNPIVMVSVDSETYTKLVHNSTVSDSVNAYFSLPVNSDWSVIKPKLDALSQRPVSCPPINQNAQQAVTQALATLNSIKWS